ncbi:MAG: hypothetical protein ACYCX4_02685 [Bacillota bacterium]
MTWVMGEAGLPFPGAPADWTVDQRRMVKLHRELQSAYRQASMKELPMPGPEVFFTYRTFSKWRDWVDKAERPKPGQRTKQYSEGWVKRK